MKGTDTFAVAAAMTAAVVLFAPTAASAAHMETCGGSPERRRLIGPDQSHMK